MNSPTSLAPTEFWISAPEPLLRALQHFERDFPSIHSDEDARIRRIAQMLLVDLLRDSSPPNSPSDDSYSNHSTPGPVPLSKKEHLRQILSTFHEKNASFLQSSTNAQILKALADLDPPADSPPSPAPKLTRTGYALTAWKPFS